MECLVACRIPTIHGSCRLHYYTNGKEKHKAMVFGNIYSASLCKVAPDDTPAKREQRGAVDAAMGSVDTCLVRVHSCCFTGDVMGSLRCDCGEQLQKSLKMIGEAGAGVIIYMDQEGRGIGLKDKLFAYNLIDSGHDTVSANLALGHPEDARDYEAASEILNDLGITRIKMLTNNPTKIKELQRHGLTIVDRIEMTPSSWSSETYTAAEDRDEYLMTKVNRMGHLLEIPDTVKSLSENSSLI